MIRITEGRHEVAISWRADLDEYAYEPAATATASTPSSRGSAGPRGATVDVYRATGGLPQRALLGAVSDPGADRRLTVSVPTSGPFQADAEAEQEGLLDGPLIPGLPDELAQPVVAGLLAWTTSAGDVRVTTAAYEPEHSSYLAMFTAAQILSVVLHADGETLTPAEEARVRALLLG